MKKTCRLIKCRGANLYRCENCNRPPIAILEFPVELECTQVESKCSKLGPVTTKASCNSCGKKEPVNVHRCFVFGIATTSKEVDKIQCCKNCPAYKPL